MAGSPFRLSGEVNGCSAGLDEQHSLAGDVQRVQHFCWLLHMSDATRAGGSGRAHRRRSSSGLEEAQWPSSGEQDEVCHHRVNARTVAFASLSMDVCEGDRWRCERMDLWTLSTRGSGRRCRSGRTGIGARPWERGSFGDVKHELVERYRGRWVAVSETGDVVADADELDVLLTLVERDGPRPDVVVQRVPEADAPMFVGLG